MKIKIEPSKEVAAYGRQLRKWRERHDVPLRWLAKKHGISITMLSRVECGKCDPVLSFVLRLAKITGINPISA